MLRKKSQTINAIGPDCFIAICLDNTNVTKAACHKITSEHSFTFNINDCVHHLHNTIGDINSLPKFSWVQNGFQYFINLKHTERTLLVSQHHEENCQVLQQVVFCNRQLDLRKLYG